MAAVDEKVKQIIVEQLQVDEAEVTPGASFQEDLGADSLDVVELVMQFEEAFDIQIPDEDAEKIKTVKDASRVHREESEGQVTGMPEQRRVVITGMGLDLRHWKNRTSGEIWDGSLMAGQKRHG